MERTAPPDKAKEYLEQYSLKLGDNLRGVMVIKAKDKTRASQRKGALANWKVRSSTVLITIFTSYYLRYSILLNGFFGGKISFSLKITHLE